MKFFRNNAKRSAAIVLDQTEIEQGIYLEANRIFRRGLYAVFLVIAIADNDRFARILGLISAAAFVAVAPSGERQFELSATPFKKSNSQIPLIGSLIECRGKI
ncbi:hypothetical protein [Bradyrhizobium sp.]|uniref:hypothetical protein n=1 Tax=Bradyrhizobium sp. TaxID=376 RepID=UPI003C36DBA3